MSASLRLLAFILLLSPLSGGGDTDAKKPDPGLFNPADIFGLEYASDPQISPDGRQIVYVRNFMDIMVDRRRSNLWIVNYDGSDHRPLGSGSVDWRSPRWSPDGKRLLYIARDDGSSQLYVRWMDTGQTARVTQLTGSPSGLAWSPDGSQIAFTMLVPETVPAMAKMPAKPEGAEWAEPPRVIEKLHYRFNGAGYLENGYTQLFVVPADGGTPRQITSGRYDVDSRPAWSADGKQLYFSASHQPTDELDPLNSEIYAVTLQSGAIRTLTDRQGPDKGPLVSPDGKSIAYLGFDDRYQGYQVTHLYVMTRNGSRQRVISGDFDRDVGSPRWAADSKGLYFQYDDAGNTRVASISLSGKIQTLVRDVGGLSLGRPYPGGAFSVSQNGRLAYTLSRPGYPADIAVAAKGSARGRQVTFLNRDLLGHKTLGPVEEIRFKSSADGREIQGWIVKPPRFEKGRKYPLILEIHGGPFANYGDRFSAEFQLYATAGYVVLYVNPRGSSSYGAEFGNLIHHNYPGQDYDDLMSAVDALIRKGYIDERQLFVTGGSGGGVLSAWIVGKTGRFSAAVVAKPVINWTSFSYTTDIATFSTKYWFAAPPWEAPEAYWKRSPLSLVGNVSTPTMLLTGEVDYRTPMSESEQFYQALKLRQVPAALVRFPGASHGITSRPSNLIAKVAHVLAWFERYRTDEGGD